MMTDADKLKELGIDDARVAPGLLARQAQYRREFWWRMVQIAFRTMLGALSLAEACYGIWLYQHGDLASATFFMALAVWAAVPL